MPFTEQKIEPQTTISFPNSLAISKDYTNFASMMNTTIYNKGGKIQGNIDFLASFNALYLHTLEKSVTHTHTHTHTFAPPVR